jgi:SAM-dependent methyltransferase
LEKGFSKEWDERYNDIAYLSVWPWSDLVSLVYRYVRDPCGLSVLELGCGPGANIPLFRSLGCIYYAIEGSDTIVDRLRVRFPELAARIEVGDFTKGGPWRNDFDLVVDRAAVTCNSTEDIESSISFVWDALKPGGYFIGVDWYSTRHADFATGSPTQDPLTRKDFKSGEFASIGRVHFSDEPYLRELFASFELVALEHKLCERLVPTGPLFASWDIVVRKPL